MSSKQLLCRYYPALLGLVVLAVSLACGGQVQATKVGEIESGATATPPQGAASYQVGDIISLGDNVMVVLGWDRPAGSQFTKPQEGKTFVAVDVLIVNQGNVPISVGPFLQMSLKDATDQRYVPDLAAGVAAGSDAPQGELAPGERVRGKVGFQVAEEATGLVFVFDAEIFRTGKVFVELGAEPVSVDPPAELAAEQAQEQFNIGDQIQIGDFTLVVNAVSYPPGNQYNRPQSGKHFVVVDLTLENTGATAITISAPLQMYLKDSTGQKYNLDLSAQVASGGATPEGELAPGERLRGQIGYQVPQDSKGLVFVFDTAVFGHGKAFVGLGQ